MKRVIARGLPNVPILPGDEGCCAVKEVLPILKIENRKPPRGLIGIAGGRVHDKVALVAQKARPEPFVLAKLSGTHCAIATRYRE